MSPPASYELLSLVMTTPLRLIARRSAFWSLSLPRRPDACLPGRFRVSVISLCSQGLAILALLYDAHLLLVREYGGVLSLLPGKP